jgi:transcriptional regulator with XRE-family HTH domain
VPTRERRRQDRLTGLGLAIQARRKEVGLSQEQLGEAVGGGQVHVSRIENGHHAVRVDRLWAMCDALDVTPAELFAAAAEFSKA